MKPAHLIAALLLPALLAATPGGAAERSLAPRAAATPITGEVIVRFKSDATVLRAHALSAGASTSAVADVLSRRAGAMGSRIGRTLQAGAVVESRTQVMRASGVDAETLAAELAADPDVEYAEPNRRARALTAPNDPLYAAAAPGVRASGPDSGQWYLRAPTATEVSGIDIETAWNITTGASSVVVAVLDTGILRNHPDFAGTNVLQGYDFVSDAAIGNDGGGRDNDPADPGDWVNASDVAPGTPLANIGCNSQDIQDSSWHGTSTASLIAATANNSAGIAGAAPGVTLLPVRVLGKCGGSAADIAAAMRWAAGIHVDGVPDNPNPAKVLNLSLGDSSTSCSSTYQLAANDVNAVGAVIVAAAGNSEGHTVGAPANCDHVIGVLALRHAGTKVGFSDLGSKISISAPGGNCVNTGPGEPCLYPIVAATDTGTTSPSSGSYTYSDSFNITIGTSFAAPLVAAAAGLMYSANANVLPENVLALIKTTARSFPSTGADNGPGDNTPVLPCHAPTNAAQDQCYCPNDGTLCGAGMLSAGAAVAAAAAYVRSPPTVSNTVSDSQPTAGASITLTATAIPSAGRTITSYAWTVADGGTLAALTGATNAATATLATSAAGSVTVQVTVMDSAGDVTSKLQSVTVQAPVVIAQAPGGGGGGALSASWLALLGLAVLALGRRAR